ncbi:MAG: hypothetical protein A3F63_15740 [Pseudomonadales bacterium RIFCSPHIGHO2_12_FULL_40_16]|jgi:predicted nucleic acid-binding protein|nr:MAG: hypothetical protein A3F63_15740 [Pseudomonadales bacterium RIFCSPHIGHO2_12_FULL_40_16]
MHHIFIDTNVFLDFYRESKQDYDQNKLDKILNKFREKSSIYKVYLTDYLKDEVFRNRANEPYRVCRRPFFLRECPNDKTKIYS